MKIAETINSQQGLQKLCYQKQTLNTNKFENLYKMEKVLEIILGPIPNKTKKLNIKEFKEILTGVGMKKDCSWVQAFSEG